MLSVLEMYPEVPVSSLSPSKTIVRLLSSLTIVPLIDALLSVRVLGSDAVAAGVKETLLSFVPPARMLSLLLLFNLIAYV